MVSLKNFIAAQLAEDAVPPPASVAQTPSLPAGAQVIAREKHNISRRQISDAALQVLNGLHRAGYQAYLVGGSVRDLLLGREPKDFDVCTDARPEEVRKLFRRNARLIGRRFILAHVQFGREIIEVATFRGGDSDGQTVSASGRILADNVYGTLEEDAQRRDFTANALYYNIADRSIIDFWGAWADIEAQRLRMIGEAAQRFHEDPVRMLRAARFAAKLGFQLDPAIESAIPACRELLREVPPARLYEETGKLFLAGFAQQSLAALQRYGLFAALFPQLAELLERAEEGIARELIQLSLRNTDARVAAGKSVHPAFLFAAMLWPVLVAEQERLMQEDKPEVVAMQQAASAVLEENRGQIAIPRRFTLTIREIWDLQARFHRRGGRRPYALLAHARFRAAFDFLQLRCEAGADLGALAQWWQQFQDADSEGRKELIEAARQEDRDSESPLGPLPAGEAKRGKRRRRRRRNPKQASEPVAAPEGE
ncbi:polynucleotide adenylyltransferase PcnB [Acidithiobacillus sp. CV18-2]|uniref:Poly(A) polymerase I n=1 Tax=Igneacidithiobacillus copahuensis TaxID=2724909 RepID=A0AAE2YNS5_9PROT|nr:polynucleotide adenylyltransferase PcnB [Igneacidithiobacillus copahuensis]MBU2754917.1 polynucleotide adenylyltransferase PcnB [Acidithiobacillus sp. CV18-3]MBU2758447.1 polynucleotide adenylyltransferase PcnB [Acidithiobacillus sp. BN09-2]MBU2778403.1 polynucleotide adenylyltransferase PcnB [Acidithiobacillus sp. CV18-2]MBU2797490.1 polynucleotide adenylyltransferase PcnB [Acidithiobacillus sp. VAN18-2]MBU2798253.1 polynucleotide adenylyltransferase PcnB [Acidithiobacillus sp. VAN18-4]UT